MGLNKEHQFFLIWAVIGAFGTLIIWHLPWRFQVNDDTIMMWLVSGAYTGEPETYAVFIHPILSWTFAKLYTLFPQIQWYPITWFLIVYFSFVVFLLSIWRSNTNKFLSIFYPLFLLAFIIHFLFFLQFSIVAAFAVAAGLTARGLKFSKKLNSDSEAVGSNSSFSFSKTDLLIALGALIRIEVLFLFLSGIFVLGFFVFKIAFRAQSLILPGLLLLFLFLFNQAWIRLESLQELDMTNKLRSAVFDDPVLQFRKEAYRDTNPELFYFANGLMDFGRESDLLQKLEIWKEQLNQDRFSVISPSYVFKALSYLIRNERYFCFMLFLLLGISLFLQPKKSLISIGVLLVIMILLSPFFLLKIQIYVIILLVYFSCLIWFGSELKLNPRIIVPAIIALPVLIVFHLYSIFIYEKKLIPKEEFDKFGDFEFLYPEFQNIYLVGLDQVNYKFIENKPVKIKYLGWPSILLNSKKENSVYRVGRLVYEENTGYFKSSQILKEYPDYIDLVFLK